MNKLYTDFWFIIGISSYWRFFVNMHHTLRRRDLCAGYKELKKDIFYKIEKSIVKQKKNIF